MANRKLQAVKVTLADGRVGLFLGLAFPRHAESDTVEAVAISDVVEYDDSLSVRDLWLLTEAGGSIQ